jgi:hypothetical protein
MLLARGGDVGTPFLTVREQFLQQTDGFACSGLIGDNCKDPEELPRLLGLQENRAVGSFQILASAGCWPWKCVAHR